MDQTMKWVYNQRNILWLYTHFIIPVCYSWSALPTFLAQMPFPCGMQCVGELAHLQGLPVQLPTLSVSVLRKRPVLLSQGKLKMVYCSHVLRCKQQPVSDTPWPLLQCHSLVADLRNSFSQALPNLSQCEPFHSTRAQAAVGWTVLQHNQEASGWEITVECLFHLLVFTGGVFLVAEPLLPSAQTQCYRLW